MLYQIASSRIDLEELAPDTEAGTSLPGQSTLRRPVRTKPFDDGRASAAVGRKSNRLLHFSRHWLDLKSPRQLCLNRPRQLGMALLSALPGLGSLIVLALRFATGSHGRPCGLRPAISRTSMEHGFNATAALTETGACTLTETGACNGGIGHDHQKTGSIMQ